MSRLNKDDDSIHFVYNYETKTLYGNKEQAYLLKDYFKWCADSKEYSSDYAMDSLGDVTFQYVEKIENRGQYDE